MPELPEVEVTLRSFADRIAGARIESLTLGKPLRWPLGCNTHQLHGRRVVSVRRRGKYLLIDLTEGMLLLHLGMSGSVVFGSALPVAGKHDHMDLVTSQGTLRLNDPRRFGALVYASSQTDAVSNKLLGHLGVEPLGPDFVAIDFYRSLQLRKKAVKQVLLDGQAVVGVGNIYASEALFLAGIRPTVSAFRISKPRAARLHAAICQVLMRAVDAGGSTLRDFSNAEGNAGHFQLEANVYGRTGLPCHQCQHPIKAIRQGQRATFYCANCQKS